MSTASYNESNSATDESSTSCRTFARDVPSFLEPREPSITNPWMRPRPTHGTNLCNLFEEDMESPEQPQEKQHLKVYLRFKTVNTDYSDRYFIESDTCLKSINVLNQIGAKRTCKESIKYKFTHIFKNSNQVSVFNKMIKSNLKEYIFNGHDFTLMTYGASGSGKTYSLMGIGTHPGIIPRCLEFLFQQVSTDSQPRFKPDDKDILIALDSTQSEAEVKHIRGIVKKCKDVSHDASNLTQYRRMSTALSRASQEWKRANEQQLANMYCEVWVSFAEIYQENIYDLLEDSNGKDPPIKLKLVQPPDHKPYIKGLKWVCVRSGMEAFSVLTRGRTRLRYANTCVNATSSRSHCIFTMKLIMYHNDTKTSKVSTFRLCDLAGLERAKMTENRGERLNESKRINSSLHVLEKCLHALRNNQQGQHLIPPYRESKLTALLQNALSGKENITMLVTINPEKKFFDETQHVLKFSALAQELLIDAQAKVEMQMSRHYSDILSNKSLSMTQQDVLKLLEDVKRREEAVEQKEWDMEAEYERFKAETDAIAEDWSERERLIRAEVANKFINIQENIYKDCDVRIEQEKQILTQEHHLQIDRWSKLSKELEAKVERLLKENKELKAQVKVLVHSLSESKKLYDTSHDMSQDTRGSTSIPHLSIKADKYDDFLKDFIKIDVTQEDSACDKLAELTKTLDLGNNDHSLTPISKADHSEIIAESTKRPPATKKHFTEDVKNLLEKFHDVVQQISDEDDNKQNNTLQLSEIPKIHQNSLLLDATESIHCKTLENTNHLENSLTHNEQSVKPIVISDENKNDNMEIDPEQNSVTELNNKTEGHDIIEYDKESEQIMVRENIDEIEQNMVTENSEENEQNVTLEHNNETEQNVSKHNEETEQNIVKEHDKESEQNVSKYNKETEQNVSKHIEETEQNIVKEHDKESEQNIVKEHDIESEQNMVTEHNEEKCEKDKCKTESIIVTDVNMETEDNNEKEQNIDKDTNEETEQNKEIVHKDTNRTSTPEEAKCVVNGEVDKENDSGLCVTDSIHEDNSVVETNAKLNGNNTALDSEVTRCNESTDVDKSTNYRMTRSKRENVEKTITSDSDRSANISQDDSGNKNETRGPRTRKQMKSMKHKENSIDMSNDENKPPCERKDLLNNKNNGSVNDQELCNVKAVDDGEEHNNNVLRDKGNVDEVRGLPLPEHYYTAKKDRVANDLAKEKNCQSLCLSSRNRKLFSRRKMDELAAEPQPPPQSARCLFFNIADEGSPDPNKPPKVPTLYTYQKPTRTTRQKKK